MAHRRETLAGACRVNNPSLFARALALLGFSIELHAWVYFTRGSRRFVYYCRRCECGAQEIQSAGPMGDKNWRPIDSPFANEWEKEDFDRALLEEVRI